MTTDGWDPDLYEKFREERSAPFFDLLALVRAEPGMRVVDLGCGTGELTARLHRHLEARETLGIDSSPAMLAKARPAPGLRFERGEIERFGARSTFDLVFSNAALHWVPDHWSLVPRLALALAPGGQLAVQVPVNHDHPSHVVARELAAEPPWSAHLAGRHSLAGADRASRAPDGMAGSVGQVSGPGHPPGSDAADPETSPGRDDRATSDPDDLAPSSTHVLSPERYAELLERVGFKEQHVRLQVYGHRLASRGEVVEWVRGTLLTPYQRRLPADLYASFLATYRERLLSRLEDARPYFFTFKRILLWGRL